MTQDANISTEPVPTPADGPLTEITSSAARWIWDLAAANVPADLHWQVLSLTLLLAALIWLMRAGGGSKGADGRARQAGLLSFILPRDIYAHQSARVDVALWISERALYPLWSVGLLSTVGPATESAVIQVLHWAFDASPAIQSHYGWMLLYSLVSLLCYDFVFFLTHYAMHRFAPLWAIHKVHHSAEVLTPLTRYREHLIDGPIWAAGAAFAYGFSAGIFSFLFNGGITQATLLNLGFFAVLFGFNGSFRHYHVQFHYPKWLAKWLHSPVMHHVHHSYLPQHWDKNFAAVTSIWDRMFGTLYIPKVDEYTPWGLGPDEQGNYRSFWQNTTGPFRDWQAMWSARKDKKQATPNQ